MSQEPDASDWDGFLAIALRSGLSVGDFWELTPRETAAVFKAERDRQKHATEQARVQDTALAWLIAALERQRRLPELKRLLQPAQTRKLEGDEMERRTAEFAELKARLGDRRGRK